MSYHNNYPRPRSRLGAAVHGFFHPNEAYRLGTRTFSAEREADYYSRSARNSEERAFSAERERNDAEYDAEYNARLYERERQRRTQMQWGTVEYGRQHLQRGYRDGYRDGTGDTYQAASGQRRVGYAYGLRDGYDTRVAQEQASLGYGAVPEILRFTFLQVTVPAAVPANLVHNNRLLRRILVNGVLEPNILATKASVVVIARSRIPRTASRRCRMEYITRNGVDGLRPLLAIPTIVVPGHVLEETARPIVVRET
ncbi:MAG: hypothetical protein Q9199_007376 [Rusavskia elegans]